jgi:hypothetical protein
MGAFAAALATAITVTPVLLAWTPEDCGPSDGANAAPGPRKYCENLRKRLIASDPGHYIMGKLENAPSIDGEPNSQHYYWINKMDNSSPTYFDGQSSTQLEISVPAIEVFRVNHSMIFLPEQAFQAATICCAPALAR